MLKLLLLVPFLFAFVHCAGTAQKAEPDDYPVGRVTAEPDHHAAGNVTAEPAAPVAGNAYTINLSKDSIFSKCMDFIEEKFFSTKDVIKLADKEKGTIVCNATMDLCKGTEVICYYGFDMIIKIKDNSYVVSFTNFVSWKDGKNKKVENSELVNYIQSNVTAIENDLNVFIKDNTGD
ncbi:MAG: DUF4468 domain-containing protein [Chitinispirillaceae bacterium]|nr:DUF4468 domain-containing protein [Chitinispirillaceae bacterium]